MFALICVAMGLVQAALPPELIPLQFLLGTWKGAGSGTPGNAAGDCTFSAGLQDRIITRTSFAAYPADGGKPASTHDDLMLIYVEAGKAKAHYYDSEGHIIPYGIHSNAPGEVVFLSEASPSAPRYRLTYRLAADKTVSGQFEIAPPGTPETFRTYLSWSMIKRTAAR
jgi:hypothetical protein